MIEDHDLIALIRRKKRKKADSVKMSIEIRPDKMTSDSELGYDMQTCFEPVHFSVDADTIVAQVKTATALMLFEKAIQEASKKYRDSLGKIYGPLMAEFISQYSNAFLKKTPSMYEATQVMQHIKAFAGELAMREESEEAIFDAKRIEAAIADGCGVDAPGSYIAWLCKQTEVYAMEMPGKRYDIGNLESYERVQKEYGGIK